jgi:hypothetical protein
LRVHGSPGFPYLQALLTGRDIVVDKAVTIMPKVAPQEWGGFYRQVLETLPSGVTEIIIHPGHDSRDDRIFFKNRPHWGAAWRQRDFDFFTSVCCNTQGRRPISAFRARLCCGRGLWRAG